MLSNISLANFANPPQCPSDQLRPAQSNTTLTPANKPAWLNNYELLVKKLLINFGPYDMIADAKVELEQLIMKDNHKATKFFIDFYQLASLLQYNDDTLY